MWPGKSALWVHDCIPIAGFVLRKTMNGLAKAGDFASFPFSGRARGRVGRGGGWNGRYGSSGWKTHNSLLVLWSISWQIGGHYHSIRGYCDGRWAIELKFSVGNLLAASYFKCLVKKKFGIGLVLKICRLIEKVSRPLRYIKDFLLNVEKEDF